MNARIVEERQFCTQEMNNITPVGSVYSMSKIAAQTIVSWKPVNERIIMARLKIPHYRHAKVTVVQVHAPTEVDADSENDEFYDQLQGVID